MIDHHFGARREISRYPGGTIATGEERYPQTNKQKIYLPQSFLIEYDQTYYLVKYSIH